MRFLTMFVVCACGLALGSTGAASTASYSPRDLPGILGPKPPGDFGWDQPDERGRVTSRADLFGDYELPGQAQLFAKLRAARLVSGYHVVWSDIASGVGLVFRDAKGAHAGLMALEDFRRQFSREIKGRVVTRIPARGLGVEAWGLRGAYRDGGELESADYGWRRANLVLWAEFDCAEGCEFDIVHAARAYANVLDAKAKEH